MIKVNELRIGNLVTWEDEPDRILKVDEIGYNRQKNRWVRFENGDGSIMDEESCQLIGIPLTEDWLVNFGFVNNSIAIYGIDKTLNISAVVDGNYYLFLDDVFGSFYDLNSIQYVHQLQNLYFALTGEELKLNGNEH